MVQIYELFHVPKAGWVVPRYQHAFGMAPLGSLRVTEEYVPDLLRHSLMVRPLSPGAGHRVGNDFWNEGIGPVCLVIKNNHPERVLTFDRLTSQTGVIGKNLSSLSFVSELVEEKEVLGKVFMLPRSSGRDNVFEFELFLFGNSLATN